MQALDLPCNPSLEDSSAMPEHYSPIHHHSPENSENRKSGFENNTKGEGIKETNVKSASENNGNSSVVVRRERPSRACTQRAAARLQAAAEAEATAEVERKRKKKRKERLSARLLKEDSEEEDGYREEGEVGGEEEENGEEDGSTSLAQLPSSRAVTPLVGEPEASQLPRWNIRSMWQLASILNFLNVFRPLLNVKVEFSAEEFETALINPNNTLAEIHMPLLKAIPPITRMALNHDTWITVLCRKLRDWWHWVAEGDLPIVASHRTEIEAYNTLDPGMRVVILKALCDIRVEQEDIRNYIDESLKHGVQLSIFRKERLGGDSYGVSYWYEDDPIIGHRLYREIRNVEVKKGRGRNIPPIPHSSYQWEAVATNLDEFLIVSSLGEFVFDKQHKILSKSLGEFVFDKQHKILSPLHFAVNPNVFYGCVVEDGYLLVSRLAKVVDSNSFVLKFSLSCICVGWCLEKLFSSKNRTEVSVGKKLKNVMLPEIEKVHKVMKEKLLKKQHRQALMLDNMIGMDGMAAGRSLRDRKPVTYTFDDYDRSINEAIKSLIILNKFINTFFLSCSDRRRQRPERYSVNEYVEAVSDAEAEFDSDDDIVGEVVYDDEYLKRKKRRKMSSSSEGDEEYHWDEENHEEEEEEEEDDVLSSSEDSDAPPRRTRALPGRTRRETKLRSVGDLQPGLRRSKRATRINYRQYEVSESDNEQTKPEKSNAPDEPSYSSGGDTEFSTSIQDSDEKISNQEDIQDIHANHQPIEEQQPEAVEEKPPIPPEQENHKDEEVEGVSKRRFLDLNELAPGSGFEDGPNSMSDEDRDDF
ncbi:hypothetical protein SASPL_149483 [Salvia splendens]|uniref:DDT domain-containing protein n=1 Tax=Salvia splendens TaxID=180675 RepID=A0A8X8WAX0_SALSN|nr:hypothetical protein SASPL_149483 [Salvia splendens]